LAKFNKEYSSGLVALKGFSWSNLFN
jgi:hypothetical protein